jgi:hypothetical protein
MMVRPQYNPPEFDTRMTDWNLKHNVLSKKQLEDFLKTLPDVAANAEDLTIDDGLEDGISQ